MILSMLGESFHQEFHSKDRVNFNINAMHVACVSAAFAEGRTQPVTAAKTDVKPARSGENWSKVSYSDFISVLYP